MGDFVSTVLTGLMMIVALVVVSFIFDFLGILAFISGLIFGGWIGWIELVAIFIFFAYVIGWLVEEIGK